MLFLSEVMEFAWTSKGSILLSLAGLAGLPEERGYDEVKTEPSDP